MASQISDLKKMFSSEILNYFSGQGEEDEAKLIGDAIVYDDDFDELDQVHDDLSHLQKLIILFQSERAKALDLTEYFQYEQCRQTNFKQRGIASLYHFLTRTDNSQSVILSSKVSKQENLRMLEIIGFILRFILKNAVQLSLLSRFEQQNFVEKTKKCPNYNLRPGHLGQGALQK